MALACSGERQSLALTVALLMSVSAHVAQAQAGHAVTLDDLLSIHELQSPMDLSPDGQLVAYSLDDTVWVVKARPGSTPGKVGLGYLPKWAPDGKRLAYYSDAVGTLQLWVFEVETHRAEPVTRLEGGIDPDPRTFNLTNIWTPLRYSWSPDGRKLVFGSQVAVPTESDPRRGDSPPPAPGVPLVLTPDTPPEWTVSDIFIRAFPPTPRWWVFWERRKRSWPEKGGPPARTVNQLFIVDVPTRTTRQLTQDTSGYFSPEWSPDGKRVACASNEGRYMGWLGTGSDIYVIDVATGDRVALTDNLGTNSIPSWAPDGRHVAFMHADGFGARRVFVTSSAGGEPVDLSLELDRSAHELLWSQDGKGILVLYTDGVSDRVARLAFPGGRVERLHDRGSASRGRMAVARSGTLVWQESDPSAPSVIRILRPGEDSSRVLLDVNPGVRSWALGAQEIVRWHNHQGEELEGILIKPVGYEAGRRYPMIVDAYPIHTNGFKGSPMGGNQAWAARGYAVFLPLLRAPHSLLVFTRSETFSQAARGPNGWQVTEDDLLSGVDALIASGVADPERLALYGFSNGGGIVNYLLTRTRRFKCAVSVAGALSDWVRPVLLNTSSARAIAYMEGGHTLWEDPAAYVQLSAVYHLDKVTTPVLLADGDEDGDFLLDTIEMYNGLRAAGDSVTLLRYPDQAHGFTGPALRDFWNREGVFLEKCLESKDGQS